MIEQVQRTMRRHGMAPAGAPLWVAVSGGVDSMVLLHVLRSMQHPCHVVHVDHGLRGAESDGDRELVAAYCSAHRIPFTCVPVDVMARKVLTGGSVQMAARELRYEVFTRCTQEGPAQLAMAHHRDDLIETYFLNHLRGMGAHGWMGIPPITGSFIRPLLDVDREGILAYAKEHAVPFRQDTSNDDPKYLRNRVRHELLPLLEDLRPGVRRILARDVELMGEMSIAAVAHAETILAGADWIGELPKIPIDLLGRTGSPHLVLRIALDRWTPHPDQLDAILRAVHDRAVGAIFPLGEQELVVDREVLVVRDVARSPEHWTIPTPDAVPASAPLSITPCSVGEIARGYWNDRVWLDADVLRFPVELRTWKDGDRMRPVGLGGSKLISDVLTDAKVPADRKQDALVLVSGGRIAWLCGHRVGEGFQATAQSQRVLCCSTR
ncbi:MAG: tRNA lysidine(34) synthetase TilS [Flavobacteriales bacterium]|nr:tRNA lysidine(34) synthetase TilS [Flavobacteriales bacterium]